MMVRKEELTQSCLERTSKLFNEGPFRGEGPAGHNGFGSGWIP